MRSNKQTSSEHSVHARALSWNNNKLFIRTSTTHLNQTYLALERSARLLEETKKLIESSNVNNSRAQQIEG